MKKIIFFIIIFFIGCNNLNLNPDKYTDISIETSKFKPSKEEIKIPKVVIYKINVYDSTIKQYDIDLVFKNELESFLYSSKSVKLIERETPLTLKEEIELAQEARMSGGNLKEANYLIIGNINSSIYNVEYSKPLNIGSMASLISQKLKALKIPSRYSYKACIIGNIKILKIPENYVSIIIPFKTCVTKSTYEKQNLKKELLLLAVNSIINDVKIKLLNFFKQKGYIYEVRRKGNNVIIKTTLGSQNGAKEGLEVNIYTIKKEKNPLTRKIEISPVKIGKGIITNNITSNSSWIIVKKLKENIKIGDYVRPVYKESLLNKLKKLIR